MQLSLFNFNEKVPVGQRVSVVSSNKKVVDIRTEKQTNRKVAYDVGVKIEGAMKDQAALRLQFENKPSLKHLEELESNSPLLAEEMVKKNKVIPPFSFEQERDNGVDILIAQIKKMIFDRVSPAPNSQSVLARKEYTSALLFLHQEFSKIKTLDEFKEIEDVVYKRLRAEKDGIDQANRYIKYATEQLDRPFYKSDLEKYGSEEGVTEFRKQRIQEQKDYLLYVIDCVSDPLSVLGDKFVNFFLKYDSRKSSIVNLKKKNATWEQLVSAKTKETTKLREKQWEREVPENPRRDGGRKTVVRKPEDLLTIFNFKGVQFGNYVDDNKGLRHLIQSAEALHDLADFLGISDKEITLNGMLSMAYGARGRGKAIGHFEPLNCVINLTRDRGSCGITAHEWFHFFDNALYAVVCGSVNGLGYLSDCNTDNPIYQKLIQAMNELMDTLKVGSSVDYIENTNKPGTTWRCTSSVERMYNGNLLQSMAKANGLLKQKYSPNRPTLMMYATEESRKKRIEKDQRAYKKDLKLHANAFAWLHERKTGERVDRIPVPSDRSQYLQDSIEMDKGMIGKYWSSNVELIARAFEAYVQDELGYQSDYLVAGTKSGPFPLGEERKIMKGKMKQFLCEALLVIKSSI